MPRKTRFAAISLIAVTLFVIWLAACMSVNTPLQEAESELFYYYRDERIPLRPIPDLIAVKFEQTLDSRSRLELLDNLQLEPVADVPGTPWYVVQRGSEIRAVDEVPEIAQITWVFRSDDGTVFFIPGQFYVQFMPSVPETDIAQLNSEYDIELVEKNELLGSNYLLEVKDNSQETALELANLFHEQEMTEYATPNFIRFAYSQAIPNDTHFGEQWALSQIEAPDAWDISTGSPDISIAVLDDGVDLHHPDLNDKIDGGFDETNDPDGIPMPRYLRDSHGTGVAGIIAAESDNDQGIAGVSQGSRIMPVQVFYSRSGFRQEYLCQLLAFDDRWVANGFLHAMQAGADVMNNSWGAGDPSAQIENAITTVTEQGRDGLGTVVVFASGNFNSDVSYPASLEEVIAVGATTESDERATPAEWGTRDFCFWHQNVELGSNYGPELDVVAPGNNIWTTARNGEYTDSFGGTSAAAPHVAGLAALVLSVNPDLTAQEVRELIEDTADNIDGYNYDANGWNAEVGHGRINARRALEVLVPNIVNPIESRPLTAGSSQGPFNIVITVDAWEGFGREDFIVQIGGEDATVLTAVRSGGHHVLTIQPPTQVADGLYDLTVTVGTRSDAEPNAVRYTSDVAANAVDVMLVIDRSGSMAGQRLTDAQSAAKQFVQFMEDGDQVGVVTFSSSASVNYGLTTITGTVRDEVGVAVDQISASGQTSIGAGLELAERELTNNGNQAHPWSIVLLSDGDENRAPYAADVLPDISAAGISVHTIALGAGANRSLMQHIAAETGGTYHFAPTSQELADIYNRISTSVANQQTLLSATGIIQPDEAVVQSVSVDNTVTQATFSVSWPGSDLDLVLETPSGNLVDPSTAASDPEIDFTTSATFEFYRISDPEPGQWSMNIEAVDVPSTGEAYSARAVAEAGLTMSLHFQEASHFTDQPVILMATLSDSAPIIGAAVEAVVELPSSGSAVFQLHDDGGHFDGQANDGVYANGFSDVMMEGSYTFRVSAVGVSSSGESFVRRATETIFVEQNPTPPTDLWIEAHGLNETVPGEQMTYSIEFGNSGPNEASNVMVKLNLDASTEYLSDTLGGIVGLSGTEVSWSAGSLSTDASREFDVTVAVTSTITQTQQIAGLFEIRSLGSNYFDPTNLNNIDVIDTIVVGHPAARHLYLPNIMRGARGDSPTLTPTPSPTATDTPSATNTPTNTPTATATPSPTNTATSTPTATATSTTPNNPPNIVSNPSPSSGAVDVPIAANLSWSGGDPDEDTVTYDVYFEAGDSTPDVLFCDDTTSASCDLGTLNYNTHYYWQVVATDEHGASTSGSVWDFMTSAEPSIGPLVYDGRVVDDDNSGSSSGDDDGQVDCGENIEMSVWLYNEGTVTAELVYAYIDTSDPYVVNIVDPEPSDPDISGGARVLFPGMYFEIAADTPDGHVISFNLYMSDDNSNFWSDTFIVPVTCEGAVVVLDTLTADGNWNPKSTFVPGDPIQWIISLENATGANVEVELTYDVQGPAGEVIYYWNGMVTAEPGQWWWGVPSTVGRELTGVHTFTGVADDQGTTSQATTDYIVSRPSIGMIETGTAGGAVPLDPYDRLVGLGYQVALLPIDAGIDMFNQYDIVYLPTNWADGFSGNYSEIEAQAADYRTYVSGGGALFVDQPNPYDQPAQTVTPSLLPYPITFYNLYTTADWPPSIINSNHYITQGLSGSDMPGPADQITELDPAYSVLVQGSTTDSPSLVVATYGQGRVLVQTANPDGGFSDEVYYRMVEWVSSEAGAVSLSLGTEGDPILVPARTMPTVPE